MRDGVTAYPDAGLQRRDVTFQANVCWIFCNEMKRFGNQNITVKPDNDAPVAVDDDTGDGSCGIDPATGYGCMAMT
jgi:hypothetical protein